MAGSSLRAAVSKRPHVGAAQLKYQYDVVVHSLTFLAPAVPAGPLAVLWTRGSKTAITGEQRLVGKEATFNQQLTLICTLFRDAAHGPAQFAEKLCSFALIEQAKRGARTVAKCKLDISPYAEVPAMFSIPRPPTRPRMRATQADQLAQPMPPAS